MDSGHLVFGLSVYVSVNKDFIFGMHTHMIKPFQMTLWSMTLGVTFILKTR